MNITFRERRTNGYRVQPESVAFEVVSYSQAAVGGPEAATIRARGDARDLLSLLDWLRVKVEIDNSGRMIWWGYIGRIEVEYEQVKVSADLETMSNRVAVAYTATSLGGSNAGERGTTAWAEDETSISEFGYKELLASLSDTTATGAATARDRALAEYKLAQAGFEPRWGQNAEASAMIYCFGWWKTLEWRYASVPTELALAFETIGAVTQNMGDDTSEAAAQAFDVSSAINLQQIEIYAAKVGSPADNLKVSICENPDDLNPGTELDSATVAGSALSTTAGWITFTLSSPLALTAGVSYFLKISRSGSQDASNYYTLTADGLQGYGAGPFVVYDGSDWAAGSVDAPFRLYTNALVETTQQIKSLIASYGQFLRTVQIEDASGISTESYRDGDSDVRYEIEKMLDLGTTNNRRLLAVVNPDRTVRIYEQRASTTSPYFITSKGVIFDPYGGVVDPGDTPAGVWMRPKDILPSNSSAGLAGLQAFFVEQVEYDVQQGRLQYRASNLSNPFDLGVQRG